MADEIPAGLCGNCMQSKQIVSDRGQRFILCQLGLTDPHFPKYPQIPVVRCIGSVYSAAGMRAPRPPL